MTVPKYIPLALVRLNNIVGMDDPLDQGSELLSRRRPLGVELAGAGVQAVRG